MSAGWTDTSICLGHPDYPQNSEALPLLRAMDDAGIDQGWVFGYSTVATHDFDMANERVRDVVASHPQRFVPIGLVNPFHAFPAVDALLDSGFKSIKILTGWATGSRSGMCAVSSCRSPAPCGTARCTCRSRWKAMSR